MQAVRLVDVRDAMSRAPRIVDGDLVFAPCPPGCDGVGSSVHTAHRLRELGKPVPRYLDVQIAFQLEREAHETIRMSHVLRSNARARRSLEPKIEASRARVRCLRSWLLRSPDVCAIVRA